MQVRLLRIVVSSPGDVEVERDAVDAAVAKLNPALRSGSLPYHFIVSRWERDAIPGLHLLGPQGRIDEALRIPDCDFLIGIFWKRFGTPVAASGSGAEHEIRQAIASWDKKQSPQVLLYFNETPFAPATPEEEEQYQKVQAFLEGLLSSSNPPLIKRYSVREDFQDLVFQNLLASALELHQTANANHLSPPRFAVTAQPLHVRLEGHSELVGDIFVKCTFATDMRPSGLPLWLGIVVYLNSIITSRLSGTPGAPSASEALIFEVGRPDSTNVNRGVVIGNRLLFDMVELRDVLPGETRTFRIANIRCNATLHEGVPILAGVSIAGRLEESRVNLGVATRSLSFSARGEELKRTELVVRGSGILLAYTPVVLTFKEEFTHAFKTKYSISPTLFSKDSHGLVSLSESSVDTPQVKIPGSSYMAGEADCSTRLSARFMMSYLGPRTRLFVSLRNLSPSSAKFEIVDNHPGVISKENTIIGEVEMCELCIKDDVASVEWELIDRHPTESATVEFMAALAFEEDFGEELIQSNWLIYGGLAPGQDSFAGTASSTLLIPRFFTSFGPGVSLKVFVPFAKKLTNY